jgi:Na+/H+-translocating membrane pyrophosphatase
VGLLIGGILPNIFASLAIPAVGRAGGQVAQEVRRRFRGMSGIMQGTQRPGYGRCVDIVTRQLHHAVHAGGARHATWPQQSEFYRIMPCLAFA